MNREAGDSLSIPYVKEILSDTTSAVYGKIAAGCPDGRNGTIAVVGPEHDVLRIADALVSCDYFDNVDGRMVPDGLPDFAGETVAMLCDNANSPYGGYLENGNDGYLKELGVRNFISAIDSTCALNPFDRKTSVHKAGAKIVVLASSYSSAYGYGDICRLTGASGSAVAVVSPVHAMFRYAVERHPERGGFAVWTTEQVLGAGVYATVWAEFVKVHPAFVYDAFCPVHRVGEPLKDRILSFLKMYQGAESGKVLDAVLVDDRELKAAELNSVLNEMLDSHDAGIAPYQGMLSGGFEFIDAAQAVVRECVVFLRKKNLFTHQVAYPATAGYETVPSAGMASQDYNADGGFTDEFKYNRAENSDFETFMLVEDSTVQESGMTVPAGVDVLKISGGYVSE